MKELIFAIFAYPFVLLGDIGVFFYRLFANIKYSFNKPKFDYEDIVEVEFFFDYIIEIENLIFYKEGNNKPIDEFAKIISLENNKFNELKNLLIENKVLEYKRYIFKFGFTPFYDLIADDGGSGEERLNIKFKDGQVFNIISYCHSKRFDNVTNYLRNIVESTEEKNKVNIQKVAKEEIKTEGFQWVH